MAAPGGNLVERVRRARRSRAGVRAGRYTAGSVIAGIISELTFLTLLWFALAGPRVASALAFVAGAVPNYVLNRRWAWERRGRVDPVREGLVYAAVVVASALVAGSTTSWVSARVDAVTAARWLQVAVTGLAFLATYGGLFVVKFVVFDRYVFSERRRAG